MPKPLFEEVWYRIIDQSGEPFQTITGLPFTYKVKGNTVIPSRTYYGISRTDFEKAYGKVPFKGPGEITKYIRGPAYVWAILHDARISLGDW
jgi:hypothetical protein